MTNHPLGPRWPITLTMSEHEWHLILRETVYVASAVEKVLDTVVRGADEKRDAWVIAVVRQLAHPVAAIDRVIELLHETESRPVPPA